MFVSFGAPGVWQGSIANAFLLPHFLLKEELYIWNPNDLYSWRPTPQNKAFWCLFSNQNNGHFGFQVLYHCCYCNKNSGVLMFRINFSSCHGSLQTSAERPVRVQGQIHAACVLGVQKEPKNNQGATCANTSVYQKVSWPWKTLATLFWSPTRSETTLVAYR